LEFIEKLNKKECGIESALLAELLRNYTTLTHEYGNLLKQIQNITEMSEKAITDLLESSIDMKDKVHYDVLTGAYNRRYLDESLDYHIKTMSRFEGALSLLILDIDYFKKYNDTYGHNEGDACLRLVSGSLAECITREADFVARYGGEEFVVVLPYTDEHGANAVAERLLENIRAKRIPHEQSDVADYVTFSIGATAVNVKYTHKAQDYIKRADEGLYISKRNGRNRYTFVEFKEFVENDIVKEESVL
jgi:diguanylate cyclase (GGDEF)-like protein